MGALGRNLIEWGVASRALSGEKESGDLHLVKVCPAQALVAVVDGLGHGPGAAAAAKLAISTLDDSDGAGTSPIALIQRCHEKLRPTRGVVLGLARFCSSDNTLTWAGVGNVEGLLIHRKGDAVPEKEALVVRPGVVGDRLPKLSASTLAVGFGDRLILATDGIRAGFAETLNGLESPQQTADRIMNHYGRDTDDALVLVVRYLNGKRPEKAR